MFSFAEMHGAFYLTLGFVFLCYYYNEIVLFKNLMLGCRKWLFHLVCGNSAIFGPVFACAPGGLYLKQLVVNVLL